MPWFLQAAPCYSSQHPVWVRRGICFLLTDCCLATGWTWECLLEWGSFMQLAMPSMLMMCIEWWTFEIGSFLAGELAESRANALSLLCSHGGLLVLATLTPC